SSIRYSSRAKRLTTSSVPRRAAPPRSGGARAHESAKQGAIRIIVVARSQPIINRKKLHWRDLCREAPMCGIAVAIDWDGAEATVSRLIKGLLHRGDVTDPIIAIGNRTAMCTRRLRIVDPVNGAQPQASFDERFLVSLNGEIYNHAELRMELAALGVPFHTA